MQILNGTLNIMNEKIDVIIDNNIKNCNNQLKMESNEKNIQNEYYEIELK